MKALIFLLGARAMDVSDHHQSERPAAPEPDLPPFATTPEQAAAWRGWARAARPQAVPSARPTMARKGLPAPSREPV